MKFCTDIRGPQRMNSDDNDFGGLLTICLVPSSGQQFDLFSALGL